MWNQLAVVREIANLLGNLQYFSGDEVGVKFSHEDDAEKIAVYESFSAAIVSRDKQRVSYDSSSIIHPLAISKVKSKGKIVESSQRSVFFLVLHIAAQKSVEMEFVCEILEERNRSYWNCFAPTTFAPENKLAKHSSRVSIWDLSHW